MTGDGGGDAQDHRILLEPAPLADVPAVLNHDTLKYHLLGPSLLKAGQDSVDQRKVSEVIYEASKGSKFFNNEEVRDKVLSEKIERILDKRRQLEKLDLSSDLRKADEYIHQLECSRNLSQHVIHVDCDAFYAAVEELDHPELKDVPFAVGKGVLTTCNYHARKFGCRSGMAGFVAMKLCPELICLPLNFEKYTAKAQEVRAILAEYDPRFESSSIDEAYLNITRYCADHEQAPGDVVAQIRREVETKTMVTISAGIAANARLAKICSNKNKPNGQFQMANDRTVIMAFMRALPTRKVNGIGRVWERELDAVGIKTCGDIYEHRAYIARLFGEKAFQFLMAVHLGLGKTDIHPSEEYERKSIGTESTFRDKSDKAELRDQLRHTAEELEKDMVRTQLKGRTLVLRIKLHTYEVHTRQTVTPMAICKADDLYKYAVPMLSKFEKEIPGMTLRLMGLRLTNLSSTKKGDVDFFGMGKLQKQPSRDAPGDWEQWPDDEFERAAALERQQEMEAAEALSQEHEQRVGPALGFARRHGKEILPNPKPATADTPADDVWACPVCGRPQPADDTRFNAHMDLCLSRQTITDVAKGAEEADGSDAGTKASAKPERLQPLGQSRKRGRPGGNGRAVVASGGAQKKLFFA